MKQRFEDFDFLAGEQLLIDKPLTWTSFDVVAKVRNALRRKLGVKKIKVGHSGTLDPLATGLLIICTGKATKTLTELTGLAKSYTTQITFGATTASYDAEQPLENECSTESLTKEQIQAAIHENFLGEIQQLPPMFSAIKKDGVALHKLARKGKTIEREPRTVTISKFDVTKSELPIIEADIDCSKGTYIRSLAHDLGQAVETGAFLSGLKRTKIADYSLENAWNLDDLLAIISAE